MAETQVFPRKKIISGSIIHHARCEECGVSDSFISPLWAYDWMDKHIEEEGMAFHHTYYYMTAEVVDE